MSSRPAAAEPHTAGWGSTALRRATLTLAISQLVSWGVLFYGFAVVAPDVTADTGWSEGLVSGAFALGLLIAGFGAPPVAHALARHDPRLVLTAGSIAGIIGMLGFAVAPNPVVLFLAWAVIGAAMAATLYEPAMAVLVALDPGRRHRTIAAVTVAGGLASTVFAPLGGWLVDQLGWRAAVVVLAIGGGVLTAVLHGFALPAAHVHDVATQVVHEPAPLLDRRQRQLRGAVHFEQAAMIATTAYLIGMLVDRHISLGTASAALGVMGVGKVAGRLLLLGAIGRRSLTSLAAVASIVQAAGLAIPLAITVGPVMYPAMALVGAAAGATTVLRPLIVVERVGAGAFAATNARIQRATTLTRAGAPLALGVAVTTLGWTAAWIVCLLAFMLAAARYHALGREVRVTSVAHPALRAVADAPTGAS